MSTDPNKVDKLNPTPESLLWDKAVDFQNKLAETQKKSSMLIQSIKKLKTGNLQNMLGDPASKEEIESFLQACTTKLDSLMKE